MMHKHVRDIVEALAKACIAFDFASSEDRPGSRNTPRDCIIKAKIGQATVFFACRRRTSRCLWSPSVHFQNHHHDFWNLTLYKKIFLQDFFIQAKCHSS